MGRTHRTVAIVVASAALLGPVAACSSSSKSATPSTTTTTTTESKKSFQVTTEDGQISLSLDGSLPPGWPNAFPVPDGAQAAGSGSLANTSSGKMVAVFTTSDTPADAYAFYQDNSELTVGSSRSVGIGAAYVGTVSFSGTYAGRVTVLSKGDTTTIVVVLDATTSGTSTGASTDY